MYLLVIAWAYVVLMMCLAEATSPQGTLLGAFFTFVLYGVLPISIAVYLMSTPLRRKKARALAEAKTHPVEAAAGSPSPDTAAQAPTTPTAAPDRGPGDAA
jgi:hypothetical protein